MGEALNGLKRSIMCGEARERVDTDSTKFFV